MGGKLKVLKLGGSVVTNKATPFSPRKATISRLSHEIADSNSQPLFIVHGGGSFGHPVARKYDIAMGYKRQEQLLGFAQTRQAMMMLNKLIIDSLIQAEVRAVSIQPSAILKTEAGRITRFPNEPFSAMIEMGLSPVMFGDAVLDEKTGFAILSGDQLVAKLALNFAVERVIFGADVDGLFTSDPKSSDEARLLNRLSIMELKQLIQTTRSSKTRIDVTDSMLGKLREIIPIVESGVNVTVVNATKSNIIKRVLSGESNLGTEIQQT